MCHSWLRFRTLLLAVLALAVWASAGFVSAQESAVRLNGAIDKLARGKSLAGAIMYDFSLYAAAQFASSDLDFIIIDMEHRGLDFERLETFLLGSTNKAEIAKQGNLQVRVPPIVRIPTYGRAPNEAIVKQVLDMGAFGIMFPAIENREQALNAVSAARYPQMKGSKYPNPVGRRGNGNMPAAWFWGLSRPEYSRRADIWPANPQGELLLFLQVETVEGVKNIDEILSVPGIGVLFVGPNDLSWSLGVPQGSPEHEAAVQTVLKACMARNIPAAITVTEADVVRRLKEGFRIASLPSGGLEAPMDATLKLARTVIQR
ncbi:MAG TPA: aldolase/citrate lyase family protein [Vicinamibacterales bacterium]|nr:aldolase/citrate lyase family protein [Vicinamibacterales bacterium]